MGNKANKSCWFGPLVTGDSPQIGQNTLNARSSEYHQV